MRATRSTRPETSCTTCSCCWPRWTSACPSSGGNSNAGRGSRHDTWCAPPHPFAGRGETARCRLSAHPGHAHLPRRPRDAGLGVPQAAPGGRLLRAREQGAGPALQPVLVPGRRDPRDDHAARRRAGRDPRRRAGADAGPARRRAALQPGRRRRRSLRVPGSPRAAGRGRAAGRAAALHRGCGRVLRLRRGAVRRGPARRRRPTTWACPTWPSWSPRSSMAFDHLRHTITLSTTIHRDEEPDLDAAYAAASARLARVRHLLQQPPPRSRRHRPSWGRPPGRGRPDRGVGALAPATTLDGVASTFTRDGFVAGGRAGQGVHRRRRRVPGRAVAALLAAGPRERLLDLPRAAGGQPQPVHVLPLAPGLRDRGREPRAAGQGRGDGSSRRGRWPARGRAVGPRPRTRGWPTSCWPTRRSGPNT